MSEATETATRDDPAGRLEALVMPDHKVIYLLPMDDEVVWCEDPAPGNEMDEADAVEYVRADEVKRIAVDFVRWWYSTPGVNTEHGFDEWMEKVYRA